jgi:hypothetical protein
MHKVASIESRRKPGRMTPKLLGELISIQSQCVHDQQGSGTSMFIGGEEE